MSTPFAAGQELRNSIVKRDLGCRLGHVNILEKRAIRVVCLLLDSRPKLEELIRDRLVG